MNEVNSNTQANAAVPPAPPAGPSLEEVQAKAAEAERAREGLLRDLQEERRKRQELEARLNTSPAPSPANQDVSNDELAKVLHPYIAPVKKQAEEFMNQYHADKGMEYLSAKTGRSKADIQNDKAYQDKFMGVARKWGITGNAYDVSVKVYELMELEDMRNKKDESDRAANSSSAASLPSGAPPSPVVSSKSFKASEWEKMPLSEYEALQEKGTFHQDEDGNIVYTVTK